MLQFNLSSFLSFISIFIVLSDLIFGLNLDEAKSHVLNECLPFEFEHQVDRMREALDVWRQQDPVSFEAHTDRNKCIENSENISLLAIVVHFAETSNNICIESNNLPVDLTDDKTKFDSLTKDLFETFRKYFLDHCFKELDEFYQVGILNFDVSNAFLLLSSLTASEDKNFIEQKKELMSIYQSDKIKIDGSFDEFVRIFGSIADSNGTISATVKLLLRHSKRSIKEYQRLCETVSGKVKKILYAMKIYQIDQIFLERIDFFQTIMLFGFFCRGSSKLNFDLIKQDYGQLSKEDAEEYALNYCNEFQSVIEINTMVDVIDDLSNENPEEYILNMSITSSSNTETELYTCLNKYALFIDFLVLARIVETTDKCEPAIAEMLINFFETQIKKSAGMLTLFEQLLRIFGNTCKNKIAAKLLPYLGMMKLDEFRRIDPELIESIRIDEFDDGTSSERVYSPRHRGIDKQVDSLTDLTDLLYGAYSPTHHQKQFKSSFTCTIEKHKKLCSGLSRDLINDIVTLEKLRGIGVFGGISLLFEELSSTEILRIVNVLDKICKATAPPRLDISYSD